MRIYKPVSLIGINKRLSVNMHKMKMPTVNLTLIILKTF